MTRGQARGVVASDADLVGQVAALVERHTGMRLQGAHRTRLTQVILRRMAESAEADLACYVHRVTCEPDELRRLIPGIAVGETEFFRDRTRWRALEREVLPGIARRMAGRPLRLWSAGCATGQEAYGLAITCHELARRLPTLTVEIVGSDINPEAIQVARRGVFDQRELRGLEPSEIGRFFEPVEGGQRVREEYRRNVRFEVLNLVKWAQTGPWQACYDLILCQQVLIYFSAAVTGRVLHALARSLNVGGMLMVGHSESMTPPAGCVLEWVGKSCGFRRTVPGSGTSGGFASKELVPLVSPPARGPEEVVALAWEDVVAERYKAAQVRLRGVPMTGDALRLAAWIHVCRPAEGDPRPLVEHALADGADHPEAHYIAAMLAAARGDTDDAIRRLKRSVYLDPRFSVAHFHLADLEARRGHGPRARRSWRNAAAASADDAVRIRRYLGGFDREAFAQVCAGRVREERSTGAPKARRGEGAS